MTEFQMEGQMEKVVDVLGAWVSAVTTASCRCSQAINLRTQTHEIRHTSTSKLNQLRPPSIGVNAALACNCLCMQMETCSSILSTSLQLKGYRRKNLGS